MNWKNPKGYKLSGVIRGHEYTFTPIFVIKTKKGIGWVSVGYLDPWNSGHTSHELEGVLLNEEKNKISFISNESENKFNLIIEEFDTDEIKNDFDRLTEPYKDSKDGDYSHNGQYKRMYQMFNHSEQ